MTNVIKPRVGQNPRKVIYSRAILEAVTSECSKKKVICDTWSAILANSVDPDKMLQKPELSGSILFA